MNIQLQSYNLTADVRMILIGLCRISSKRNIRYSLQEKSDSDDWVESDSVLIINGEDQESLLEWQKVKSDKPAVMSILINNDEYHDNLTTYSVDRGSIGIQLLDLLDRIVNSREKNQQEFDGLRARWSADKQSEFKQFLAPEPDKKTASAAPAAKVSKQSDKQVQFDPKPKKRTLIVDDSQSVRRQLKEFLEKQGFAVDEASSANEALDKAKTSDYNLIFLDVVMPEMDGYKACKKIKKIDRCVFTPVVMLTSKSSTFNKARGILAGCDAYLTKPVNVNRLRQVLLEKA